VAYDAVGNHLSLATTNGSTSYEYDAANRLTSVNGVGYTWDNNGKLLSDGVRSYSYDHANRLVQVVSGTLTTEFAYPSTLRLVSLSNRRADNGAGAGSADHLGD
jgi:YD repeat-containing protein